MGEHDVTKECRVYGNQHGTWVVLTGELADRIDKACKALNITPEEFVKRALTDFVGSTHEP